MGRVLTALPQPVMAPHGFQFLYYKREQATDVGEEVGGLGGVCGGIEHKRKKRKKYSWTWTTVWWLPRGARVGGREKMACGG